MFCRIKHLGNSQFLIKNFNVQSFLYIIKHYFRLTLKHRRMATNEIHSGDVFTIGTHDGTFHCDEALACFMLKILHPTAKLIRSRDSNILNTCDFVVDVGGVYDPEHNRFDHHQKQFDHSMSTLTSDIKSSVRLSSAGLIYHHFGRQILKNIICKDDETMIDFIYKRVYFDIIQEIDGIDNGIPSSNSESLYNINTHVSARVSRLNKSWNFVGEWNDMEQFEKAIDLVGTEFVNTVNRVMNIIYPAREIVLDAIQNRYKVHTSGEIIMLPQYCPWTDHLFELEETYRITLPIKYVIFQADNGYRVQAVPLTNKNFVCRKFLPLSWRGLREETLSKVSGIKDCVFVHHTGFIGGSKTIEAALEMAIKAVQNTE